ncbi:MAG TPA: STAS domain-containing protein [Opitutus sp.]|nr:STAS domain-containing protein [Opitutus sp.]
MDITTATINNASVLTLTGRLDGLTSPALERKFDELAAAGARKIVVDCSALLYVSSAGLRVFLAAAKKLKAAGGEVAFAALSPAVQEVFELSGFTGVLAVHPTVAAATT